MRASVYTSPPRANRKPVVQLLDGAGRTFGYAKIGVNPLTRSLVRTEAEALATIGARSLRTLRAPGLLHHGEWRELSVIVQAALAVTSSGPVPDDRLSAAMVEVSQDASAGDVPAAANPYVDGLRERLDQVATPRGRWLRSALDAWVSGAGDGDRLRLGAWHGDWTPWNMAFADDVLSVWDWERYESGVPAGYDALHCSSQAVIMSRAQTPQVAIESLLAAAPGLLVPFGVAGPDAARVAVLYLIELGARYEGDGQEAAGARLGALESWLLPVIAARLGLPPASVGS